MKNIIILLFVALIFSSCSSPKIIRDDAVRIKKGLENKYNFHPQLPIIRNGSTLRGEILSIKVEVQPDSCPVTSSTKFITKSYLLFIDSSAKNDGIIEKIPLDDLDLIGPKLMIQKNKYQNINFFETYNNPLVPLSIREVPVDTIFINCVQTPCPCEKIDLQLPCLFCFECPKREPGDWFLSIKPGIAFYDDVDNSGMIIGREDYLLDMAFGLRWGTSKRWATGLILSTGVHTLNKIDSNLILRPSINFYGRYDLIRNKRVIRAAKDTIDISQIYYDTLHVKSQECCEDSIVIIPRFKPDYIIQHKPPIEIEERPCINPFIYSIFGANFDEATIDLFKLKFSRECNWNENAKIPINYGFGLGVDIPLSKNIDLSTDIGFRSIAYGGKYVSSGYLIPNNRRVNAIIFRLGIVY